MKIVVLGAHGQLGHELLKHLKKEKNLKSFSKETLDISNLSSLENMIRLERPDILVNAAAYTAVDNAENNSKDAFKINSEALLCIAKNLQSLDSFLIHYSTDYVFDGLKETYYKETDLTCPLNIYGKSKLEGENHIQNIMKNYFILRTSWVIGDHGTNFARTIIKLINEKETIKVIDDQYGVPTSTELLSDVTYKIISKIKGSGKCISGIYNVCPKGKTTWYGIAKEILSKITKEKKISTHRRVKILPIKTSDYKALALRPKNSLLSTKKIEKMLDFEMPYWKDDFNQVLNKII